MACLRTRTHAALIRVHFSGLSPSWARAIMIFRILWGIDVILGIMAAVVFVIGIGDGSVSSFNIVMWLLLLAVLASIVFGSRALNESGHRALAAALAAAAAIPAIIGSIVLIAA